MRNVSRQLAYDIADARYTKKNPGALKPRRYLEMVREDMFSSAGCFRKVELPFQLDPDFFTIFTFLYHYCGLFTGPYFSFQVTLRGR